MKLSGQHVTIPFGKYGPNGLNKEISEIPSGYLWWLMGEEWFEEKYPTIFEAVEYEIEVRDRSGAHFYTDEGDY